MRQFVLVPAPQNSLSSIIIVFCGVRSRIHSNTPIIPQCAPCWLHLSRCWSVGCTTLARGECSGVGMVSQLQNIYDHSTVAMPVAWLLGWGGVGRYYTVPRPWVRWSRWLCSCLAGWEVQIRNWPLRWVHNIDAGPGVVCWVKFTAHENAQLMFCD